MGGMNLESSVSLAFREELAKIEDVDARAAEYARLLADAYARGEALHMASVYAIDDLIDPSESRSWIANGLKSVPNSEPLRRGRRTFLDTW